MQAQFEFANITIAINYNNLNFNNYDIVVTEGIHYTFLKYFDNFKGKLILHDSITSVKKIREIDYALANKLFENSLDRELKR